MSLFLAFGNISLVDSKQPEGLYDFFSNALDIKIEFAQALAYTQSECDYNHTCDSGQTPIERIGVIGTPPSNPPPQPSYPEPPFGGNEPPDNGGGGSNEPGNQNQNTAASTVPLNGETVADLLAVTKQMNLAFKNALLTSNLTPQARAFLTKVVAQSDRLLSKLNSTAQITNHLINYELALAGSEFLSLMAGLAAGGATGAAFTAASAALGVSGGVVVFVGAAAAVGVGFLASYYAENYLDKYIPYILDVMRDNYNITITQVYNEVPPFERWPCIVAGTCQIPPLIVDSDSNGISLRRPKESPAFFELNGDGIKDHVSLPTGGNFLVFYDINNNGYLDDIRELMLSRLSNKGGASDLDGLEMLDSNNDGKVDHLDDHYYKLHIFNDVNNDGIIAENETQPASGINLSFDLHRKEKYISVDNAVIANEIKVTLDGSDGKKRKLKAYDVFVDAFVN